MNQSTSGVDTDCIFSLLYKQRQVWFSEAERRA
jgi:hypothetical protein